MPEAGPQRGLEGSARPDCSSFGAAKKSLARLELGAKELCSYLDEPPQMKSAAVGKVGYLRLDFRRDEALGRTVLADLDRRAPLLAQKALYWDRSQPDMACVITIESTGCIVQGDRMALCVHAGEEAHALVTTQCATKVHVMEHNYASFLQHFTLGERSWLEYVPAPLILHRHARFVQDTWITLPSSAGFVFGEILMPGRRWHHAEEQFGFDLYSAGFHVLREDGRPLFEERLVLEPEKTSFCNVGVMAGYEVFGSLFALVPEACIPALKEGAGSDVTEKVAFGALSLPGNAGVAFRVLGRNVEDVQAKIRSFRSLVRKTVLGRELPPRFLWS
ncbi:urease accessory protein UreD [Mailhella massiliensis]|uniref:urease accessory protein UreD n=1 Tax=Mailhella massiliensis TaxID=1903261 RepID=UPI0009F81BD8|nr:urease accessory protein UreD [Mailhella massiliensis]